MQYAHAYTRPYSDTALKDLKNRHAQWDKQSQYHSVSKGSDVRVDDVKFGEKDIREELFNSQEYKLLQYSMQRCYRKLHVTGARTVTLERQEYSFQDDPELSRKGKLVFKHDNI